MKYMMSEQKTSQIALFFKSLRLDSWDFMPPKVRLGVMLYLTRKKRVLDSISLLLMIAIFGAQFAPLTAFATSAEALPPQNLSSVRQNITQQDSTHLENVVLPADAQAILDALAQAAAEQAANPNAPIEVSFELPSHNGQPPRKVVISHEPVPLTGAGEPTETFLNTFDLETKGVPVAAIRDETTDPSDPKTATLNYETYEGGNGIGSRIFRFLKNVPASALNALAVQGGKWEENKPGRARFWATKVKMIAYGVIITKLAMISYALNPMEGFAVASNTMAIGGMYIFFNMKIKRFIKLESLMDAFQKFFELRQDNSHLIERTENLLNERIQAAPPNSALRDFLQSGVLKSAMWTTVRLMSFIAFWWWVNAVATDATLHAMRPFEYEWSLKHFIPGEHLIKDTATEALYQFIPDLSIDLLMRLKSWHQTRPKDYIFMTSLSGLMTALVSTSFIVTSNMGNEAAQEALASFKVGYKYAAISFLVYVLFQAPILKHYSTEFKEKMLSFIPGRKKAKNCKEILSL